MVSLRIHYTRPRPPVYSIHAAYFPEQVSCTYLHTQVQPDDTIVNLYVSRTLCTRESV